VAKLEKHNNRLTKIKRQIRLVYSSTLVGFFECLPLGVLQIMYSLQCSGQSDMMSQLSLVTTWLMLCSMLVTMWDYRKKQKKKVTLLLSLEKAADDGTEASMRPEEDQERAQPWNESIEMSGMSTSSKTRTTQKKKPWGALMSVQEPSQAPRALC